MGSSSAANTIGVIGSSSNGFGVQGYTNNNDLQITGDFHCDANNKVWIEAAQINGYPTAEPLNSND